MQRPIKAPDEMPGHSWPEAGLLATKNAAFVTGASAPANYDNAMNSGVMRGGDNDSRIV